MEPIKTPFDILAETISNPVKWYDRVKNEKPLSSLVDQIKPLSYKPFEHNHGPKWDDCEWCDQEITDKNPGVKVWLKKDGQTLIAHACKRCLTDPEYMAYLAAYYTITKIENY
jgi:hypothetical protein